MKETGLTISGMAMILSCCWTILFLTTFPALVFGGRRDPAAGATGQWISEGPAEASAEYHFAETIHGVTASELDNKIQNPHQLQQNGIRGHDTFRVWKDKKLLQPSYSHEQQQHPHRLLIGSSPPTCRGKCDLCQPCKPVHVIIAAPRVTITEQEYYPEVWRCQCGNMLYMP
ncbi:hypothetical protein CY35_08G058400 [Sphagnum magellanicum]|nr:hypothetical protein CY35_08G058400 [Sphagnum magellanicum]